MKVTLDFYKRLLDNLDDGVYIVNWEREIVYWNISSQLEQRRDLLVTTG
jgi:hypothetical protein